MEIIYQTRGKQRLAQAALDQRLYTKRGRLMLIFAKMARSRYYAAKQIIVMAFHRDQPIAVCHLDPHGNIMLYVKPSYRRQGIGTHVSSLAIENSGKERSELSCYHGSNVPASDAFWKKQRVLNINTCCTMTEEQMSGLLHAAENGSSADYMRELQLQWYHKAFPVEYRRQELTV